MRDIILLSSFHTYTDREGSSYKDDNGIPSRFYRGLCFERYRNSGAGLPSGVTQNDHLYPQEIMRWGLYDDQSEVLKE